jgi:hypothetical protein
VRRGRIHGSQCLPCQVRGHRLKQNGSAAQSTTEMRSGGPMAELLHVLPTSKAEVVFLSGQRDVGP